MSAKRSLRETSILLNFSVLPDPRKSRNQEYSLFDIVSVAILGVLCGADDWVTISLWAESNHAWLQQFSLRAASSLSHSFWL